MVWPPYRRWVLQTETLDHSVGRVRGVRYRGPMATQRSVLVVSDLDGTLWDEHQWIHHDTAAAIAELESRGVELLLATGRRLSSARSAFALNDLWKPSIMLNGTLGALFPDDELFHTACFPVEAGAAVHEVFLHHGHEPVLYGSDGLVYGAATATTGATHRRALAADLIESDPVRHLEAGTALALSINGVQLDGLEGLCSDLQGLGLFVDVYQDPLYGQWSITAQPPGVSKQTGIDAYIAHRFSGEPRPAVIALGDAGNDVEMIAAADIGIAMQNGHESVTSIADRLVAGPAQGGWAQVLLAVDEFS